MVMQLLGSSSKTEISRDYASRKLPTHWAIGHALTEEIFLQRLSLPAPIPSINMVLNSSLSSEKTGSPHFFCPGRTMQNMQNQ
jgi:hypothetical protein